ncbi:MAG: hypothetical protein IBX50_16955 [Marinospirillum sp.]|uniref:hypothetical protein n=1 Tax=Marinospirillum sp. TaxID=2183934 RepID=UPI0019F824E5|nr:hypothetical protein [Marinospirillum sp.]MBE0508380.1 hypothetical protein [Marinospirillum sp.]
MDTYHGTSKKYAAQLQAGMVDVTKGGGELGRGFYTGEHLYLAKAWAYHVSGDAQQNVVHFEKSDSDVMALRLEVLGVGEAALRRKHIKLWSATRSYQFGVDMVWAPIVGSSRVKGDQCKWESDVAQAFLNGSKCVRNIV